jgi:hypothetical protein
MLSCIVTIPLTDKGDFDMQVKFLNQVYYGAKRLFTKLKYFFPRVLFIVLIGSGTLFLTLSNGVFAGNVLPPIAALSNNVEPSTNDIDEFGLQGNNNLQNQNLALSSDMFGISGPLAFNITISDPYGLILNAQYTRLFNQKNAYSILADLGFKTNRVNLTLGHAFSHKNRIKLSVERLAQKQSFEFDSGSIDKWVSQYAGGAEFQHLLGAGVLNNFAVGGYYARALSQNLDPVVYDVSGAPWVNYRHIAGATSKGINTSVGVRPWKSGILTLTGYYDWVQYHNIYANVSANDSQEFGFGVTWNQYITESLQGTLSYTHRAVYKTVEAGIQWVHNIFHQTRAISLALSGSHSSSDNVPHDNSLTVGMEYHFAPINHAYQMPSFHMNALKTWTATPAVHMDQVIVAADQMSEAAFILPSTDHLFSFSTIKLDSDQIAENIHWGEISTNIPHAQLEYHLTILKEPNPSVLMANGADSEEPIIQDIIVAGHDYVDKDIKIDETYKVILKVVEKTTGFSQQYSDSFSVKTGTVSWPDGFHPRLVYLGPVKGEDKIRVALYFESATSSTGLPVHYDTTVINDDTQKKVIDHKKYNNDNIKDGSIELLVTPSKPYTIDVMPWIEDYAFSTMEQTDTVTPKPTEGTITWTVDKIDFTAKDSDDISQGADITWADATPSNPYIDKIKKYFVTISLDKTVIVPKTEVSEPKFFIDAAAKLKPNTEYTVTLEAEDEYDANKTLKDIPLYTTKQSMTGSIHDVNFNWNDQKDPSKGFLLKWTGPQPSMTDDHVYYHLTVKQSDQTIVDVSDLQEAEYTISEENGLLPNKAAEIIITAKDTYDKSPSPYDNKDFEIQAGEITGEVSNPVFTWNDLSDVSKGWKLTWDTNQHASMSNTTLYYDLTIKQGDQTVVSASDLTDTTYTTQSAGKLLPNTTYSVEITTHDEYDGVKPSSTFTPTTPIGKISWSKVSATIESPTTLQWNAPDTSVDGANVTYNFTITYQDEQQVEHTLLAGETTSTSKTVSYQLPSGIFLPNVIYTINFTAGDDYDQYDNDHQTVDQQASVSKDWSVTWNDSTKINLDKRIEHSGESSAKDDWVEYTFTITPDVGMVYDSTPLHSSEIQYQYKITENDDKHQGKPTTGWQTLDVNGATISFNTGKDVSRDAVAQVEIRAYVEGFEGNASLTYRSVPKEF